MLLDASAQHAGRTGREILTVAARTMGLPTSRVDEMLDLVSLTPEEAGRRVRHYSLGMRQRLGIATALLGEPGGADPRRARQRPRPGRHPLDARPAARVRRPRRHRAALLAPAARDRGHRRRPGRHRPAAGSSPRAPRPSCSRPPARWSAPPTRDRAGRALTASGIHHTPTDDDTLRIEADPELVGKVALQAGIALRELRPADGAGLEEMFLELTADTQTRRSVPHDHHDPRPRRGPSPGAAAPAPIPLSRIVAVEARKSFDTRSGFWLLASIGITALLATVAVILWAPDSELTYDTFAAAIGFPMAVILPMVAILSVTSEWSQRSGLTTFTLVPHRGRVVARQGGRRRRRSACVSMLVAMAIGALGNIVGSTIAGVDTVWDDGPMHLLDHRAGQRARPAGRLHARRADPQLGRRDRGLLRLRRSCCRRSPRCWPTSQEWFRDLQPWVDFNYAQGVLFNGGVTGGAVGPARRDQPGLAGRPARDRAPDGAPLRGQVAARPRPAHRTSPSGALV